MDSVQMYTCLVCVCLCNKFSALIQIIIFSAPLTESRDLNANFMSVIIATMFTQNTYRNAQS